MGVYGPIEIGSDLEHLAIAGLRNYQHEKISENLLLSQAAGDVKHETLQKTYTEYIKAADPFTEEELKKSDERRIKQLNKEIEGGPFGIIPMIDTSNEQITLRTKPRLRKPYAIKRRRK